VIPARSLRSCGLILIVIGALVFACGICSIATPTIGPGVPGGFLNGSTWSSGDSSGSWDGGSWDWSGSDSGSWDSGGWDSGGSDSGSWDSGGWDSGSWDSGGSDSGAW
jgi:hypothetical protein